MLRRSSRHLGGGLVVSPNLRVNLQPRAHQHLPTPATSRLSSRAAQASPASIPSSVDPEAILEVLDDDVAHQQLRQADALEIIASQMTSINNTLQSIDNTLKLMGNT